MTLPQLAARLAAADYTAAMLRRALGITFPDDIGALNHAPTVERLRRDRSAAGTLTRLFFLEEDEPSSHVTAALTRKGCEELVQMGVLQRRGDAVRSRVRIDPVGDQYFVADRRFRAADRGALRLPKGDRVYPPSSDSLMLRDAIVAPEARRILDLCTGSGVQAVQRAANAEHAIAVDINPRAAVLARLNAQLNGVDTVQTYVGDLYGPVRGQRFDLIIANPPFVPSPYLTAPSYHSGGATGDRVLRRIIAGLSQYLGPGGRAFAISHLAVRAGEDVQTVAARWFRDFAGRALVLVLETGTPVDLAAAQSLFALDRGLSAYAKEVRRWVDQLRRHRVETVSLLLIVAERGDRKGVDVIEAQPRTLPIPLTPPPAQRVAAWLST